MSHALELIASTHPLPSIHLLSVELMDTPSPHDIEIRATHHISSDISYMNSSLGYHGGNKLQLGNGIPWR